MKNVTVLSPRGQLPARQQMSGAPRIDSLEGKIVYIVDVRWPYTRQFLEELYNVLSERFPDTKFMLREKTGPYGENDPKLWSEIQEKGDAAIIGVGH